MGIRIALAGNPNCGKTTMFNDLTGARQYVGNWPGVTVEKNVGLYSRDMSVSITVFPGVNSLSPYSPEEIVTRDYLLDARPDCVINLVDATNLERNLYLTTQVLDLGLPVVIALNMMDLVKKNGDKIDVAALSAKLGCPIVETSALRGTGMEELIETAVKAANEAKPATPEIRYASNIETAISEIAELVQGKVAQGTSRWYATKLFEGEERTTARLNLSDSEVAAIDAIRNRVEAEEDDDAESIITSARYESIVELVSGAVETSRKSMNTTQKIDRIITNRWLGLPIFVVIMFLVYYLAISVGTGVVTDWANDGISGDGWLYTNGAAYEEDVEAWEGDQENVEAYLDAAEEAGIDIDAVSEALEAEEPTADDENAIADFFLEAPAAGVTAEIEDEECGEVESFDIDAFQAAVEAEEPDPTEYGLFIPGLTPVISDALENANAAAWVQSLVIDGVVAGVGAVIGFIPQMIILFLLLSILEACGYMARVAFIMDRIFRKFGLSGKSFIPMLVASGCGVPAVLSTKTIENENDRRMTIMTTTMIPCGAKMPIIALVFGALAGGDSEATWWVAPMFYFLGVIAIIVSGIMLKKTRAFAGEATPFVMELPQYHIPAIKTVIMATWERVKSYVVKAGTIIFLSSIVIWFLMSFGIVDGQFGLLDDEMDNFLQYSLMALVGNCIGWVFAPLGFGNWQSAVTSITGLVAKENVVATVGILTSLGDVAESDPDLWTAFGLMFGGSSSAIIAFCAFNLLCAPCFAAIGTIWRQMGNAKWTWITIAYMTGLGWAVGLMLYQLGGLISGEVSFNVWTVVAAAVLLAMLFQLLRPMPDFSKKKDAKVKESDAA